VVRYNAVDNTDLCSSCLRLKEHGLAMSALVARMILCARQCWVSDDVADYLRQLVDIVLDLVDVNAHVVRLLLVVAVPTRVQQLPVLLVLFRIQHVVALLAKLYADKRWSVRRHFG